MPRYSIWLTPQEPEYGEFENLIEVLGKKHKTPVFDPHVTLLGGVEGTYDDISTKYRKVVEENPDQLKLSLLDVFYESVWNRALYVKCEQTAELLNLFTQTLEIFEYGPQEYMPHLSFLYGDAPRDVKPKIAQELRDTYPKEITIGSVDLYETKSGPEYVSDWKRIESLELT